MTAKKLENKIKYLVYCRKSSEAEDKQVQSIETQKREVTEFAEKNEIEIVDILEETQSAHTPGRPVFAQLINRIEKGEANGLLVLYANRISRNPIDTGMILHLMDIEKLIEVRTTTHVYHNTSTEKMLLTIEFMISKKDSDEKSESVKTGLKTRYLKGYPNGVAPIGFLNDLTKEKGDRGWIVDTTTFPIVKQILELFYTGRYSIRQMLRVANEEMGLRTPLHKKQGGKKLVLSHLTDTILKNPVYAGFFFSKDGTRHEVHPGIPRMISEEQYWKIQKIMGQRGRPRPSVNERLFAYLGYSKCGACGGTITAENKLQLICPNCKFKFAYTNKTNCPRCEVKIEEMVNPTYLNYIYYHCTKRKDASCTQGSIEEDKMDEHAADYFAEHLEISPALRDWCLRHLDELEENKKKNEFEVRTSLEREKKLKEKEYEELIRMKVRGLIEEDDFVRLKTALKEEIEKLDKELNVANRSGSGEALEKAKKAFSLAVGIAEIFRNGEFQEKSEVLAELGSNLIIKDKKLSIINDNLFSIIINGLLESKAKNPLFEPRNITDTSERNGVFHSQYKTLLRIVQDVRTIFEGQNEYIYIPDLRKYSNA